MDLQERFRVIQNLEDKVISDFLDSIGPWHEFVVICGGFALSVYKLYLTESKGMHTPVIHKKVPDASKINIERNLYEAGFTLIRRDTELVAKESYVNESNGMEVEIELVTDSAVRMEGRGSLAFETHAKKKGRVICPGTWMFRRGLTFPRRTGSSKMLKDLYGIWYVATQLGSFSEQALTEFNDIALRHSRWFETFQKNLHNWMKSASPSEWSQLESQDPYGRLKKLGFERIMKRLSALLTT